jgi:hypothetical protein
MIELVDRMIDGDEGFLGLAWRTMILDPLSLFISNACRGWPVSIMT